MMFALVHSQLLAGIALPAPDPALEIPALELAGEKEMEETFEILSYSATVAYLSK